MPPTCSPRTAVTISHLGRRAYIAAIAPFHRLVVKSTTRRAERSGRPPELSGRAPPAGPNPVRAGSRLAQRGARGTFLPESYGRDARAAFGALAPPRPRRAAQRLRRLAEGADEGAAHPLGIGEAGRLGDALDRLADDCTRARATSMRSRSIAFDGVMPVSAMKARAKCRALMPALLGEVLHRQRRVEMFARPGKQRLEAPGRRLQFQQRRELRLAAARGDDRARAGARSFARPPRRNPPRPWRAPGRCRR